MPSPAYYRSQLLECVTVGYGLMSLTVRKDPIAPKNAFFAINKVLDIAADEKAFFNVGEFYGPDLCNYKLLQSYFDKYRGKREKVIISAKGAFNFKTIKPMGDSKSVSESIEKALSVFGGYVDIFQPARLDIALAKKNGDKLFPRETFDTIASYVDKGKVGGISLSEVNAEQIRAIHKEYGKYLACAEVELSLFCTDIIKNGVLDACNELGLPVVAYSPLGRGMLTGAVKSKTDIPKGDFRLLFKRFQGEAIDHNVSLVEFLENEIIAKRSDKVTLAQIAIAWIRSVGKRYPNTKIIPIPSGSTVEKVSMNFDFIELSDEEVSKIDSFLESFKTAGGRFEMAG
ncbi:unnamed protein product [Kluyveromyces dobzhanskii CBS 2104]|uniref:WGS project CCBQ000000000 data, contig 00053 n=1 Tax=Kluyveromyces dobzhanskii CBS 2104 TaxID=1427455 RepID=A0A0A8L0Q6_9SACH|nr:unnamed protein product [Kluyveromyces dobzhanskii CBS 2104]